MKYFAYIPELGTTCADTTKELNINGKGLVELAKQTTSLLWLDIHKPTPDDIHALASVFGIAQSVVERMLDTRVNDHRSQDTKQLEFQTTDAGQAQYLCWNEIQITSTLAHQYISPEGANKSRVSLQADTNQTLVDDYYTPVPPWLQPAAIEVRNKMNWERFAVTFGERTRRGVVDDKMETARKERVQRVLELLDRPVVADRQRTLDVLERWGQAEIQGWKQAVLNHTEQTLGIKSSIDKRCELVEQFSQTACDLIGCRKVQLWRQGSVVVTLHGEDSPAVTELSRMKNKCKTPEDLMQSLIEYWVDHTMDCLTAIESYADRLDHELTQPVHGTEAEASYWTPLIARSRKVALAVLRHCQINEDLLKRLNNRADGYIRQFEKISDTKIQYKRAEQRLSRLHTIMLDRQRLRLLSTQKDIHYYFRVLVSVTLVFLPIELWYNLDNLNGITTPGTLQPQESNDEDFWFTVLGMVVWAVAAIFLYLGYIRFFERVLPVPIS